MTQNECSSWMNYHPLGIQKESNLMPMLLLATIKAKRMKCPNTYW